MSPQHMIDEPANTAPSICCEPKCGGAPQGARRPFLALILLCSLPGTYPPSLILAPSVFLVPAIPQRTALTIICTLRLPASPLARNSQPRLETAYHLLRYALGPNLARNGQEFF
jgi:hypothetical protein